MAREQAARDRILLDTFATEEDLKLARDGKLRAIESRIVHAEKRVTKLQATLDRLELEAARLELSGKPVTEKVRRDISAVQRQIEDNRGFIERRRQEKKQVQAKFDTDLARYQELRGPAPD